VVIYLSENEEKEEQQENGDTEDADYHPMIIETEDKEIMEVKPPNDKILQYNILERKKAEEEAKEGSDEGKKPEELKEPEKPQE